MAYRLPSWWNGSPWWSRALVLSAHVALTSTLPSLAFVLCSDQGAAAPATPVITREVAFVTTTSDVAASLRGVGQGLEGTWRGRKAAGGGGLTMILKRKMRKRRNSSGDFFVDESCVDCDICCWMDPRTFKRSGLGAVVASQPKTEEDRMRAFQAMLACPAGSIRVMRGDRQVIKALESFPLPVDEERLPGIYQLGPTTRESMGNTPYLIVRPGKGNIMIDVPRYLEQTADQVAALGDVKYMIVTARDNADGHERWKKKFPGMIRILHRLDLARKTRIMEERLDGKGPWYLVEDGFESPEDGYVTGDTARFDFLEVPDEDCAPYDPTVKIVGIPGQTRGSIGVIVEWGKRKRGGKERLGFTGGTVGMSVEKQNLDTFTRTLETDRATLASSVRLLSKEGITWLMPGRGARVMYRTRKEGKADLEKAAERTEALPNLAGNRLLFGTEFL
ncbi:unnamed protein product [Ectocarpus sp. CCAP 1310/34]|nr:unnamed protein product [Ectocarpus sp. CCAP 1310/34]